jgi:hypothetical protein
MIYNFNNTPAQKKLQEEAWFPDQVGNDNF